LVSEAARAEAQCTEAQRGCSLEETAGLEPARYRVFKPGALPLSYVSKRAPNAEKPSTAVAGWVSLVTMPEGCRSNGAAVHEVHNTDCESVVKGSSEEIATRVAWSLGEFEPRAPGPGLVGKRLGRHRPRPLTNRLKRRAISHLLGLYAG
jgi:hypothetical protein